MTHHGRTAKHQHIIKSLLKPFAGNIDKVALFGSRALGHHQKHSEINLVLYGKIDEAMLDQIYTAFDESNLPVTVDVNAYDLIDYRPLKDHINKIISVLFTRVDLLK